MTDRISFEYLRSYSFSSLVDLIKSWFFNSLMIWRLAFVLSDSSNRMRSTMSPSSFPRIDHKSHWTIQEGDFYWPIFSNCSSLIFRNRSRNSIWCSTDQAAAFVLLENNMDYANISLFLNSSFPYLSFSFGRVTWRYPSSISSTTLRSFQKSNSA